jgi:hypothetical protein
LENKSINADPKPGNNRVSPVRPCEGRGRDRSASLKIPRGASRPIGGEPSSRAEGKKLSRRPRDFQRTLRAHATTSQKKLPGSRSFAGAAARRGRGGARQKTLAAPPGGDGLPPARSAAAGNAKTTISHEASAPSAGGARGLAFSRPPLAVRGGARAVFPSSSEEVLEFSRPGRFCVVQRFAPSARFRSNGCVAPARQLP